MTWIEVRGRYDWIAYRQDEQLKRLSRIAKIPIEDDELCKYSKIYKVKQIWEYSFKIISERDDI